MKNAILVLIVKISLLSSVFDNVSKDFFFTKRFCCLLFAFFFNLKVTGKYSLQNALCVCVLLLLILMPARTFRGIFFFFC